MTIFIPDTIHNVCETPKRQPGVCLLIRSCPEVLQLLHPERRTTENLLYVMSSHCGYKGESSVVCCPLGPSAPMPNRMPSTGNASPTKSVQTEVPEHIVDVSTSPRLKLLPLANCGPDAGEKIYGGKEVALMEYPWMALLGDEACESISSVLDVLKRALPLCIPPFFAKPSKTSLDRHVT